MVAIAAKSDTATAAGIVKESPFELLASRDGAHTAVNSTATYIETMAREAQIHFECMEFLLSGASSRPRRAAAALVSRARRRRS
jgi:hypothetical protein